MKAMPLLDPIDKVGGEAYNSGDQFLEELLSYWVGNASTHQRWYLQKPTRTSPGRQDLREVSFPEFTRVLTSHMNPFLDRGSLFWISHTRLSSLGLTYLGLRNSESFVDPRWVSW